jgi:hypothetical protein
MNRRILGLVAVAAMATSLSANAQLISSVVTDGNGLMWANTVGINLGWSQSPIYPDTAQGWVAGLNAGDYGGYDDWTLATGDGSFAPNTTTNQLGELFYTDCGNSVGRFTSLNNPGKSCSALSSLQGAITADDFNKTGMPLDIIVSATPYHPLDEQFGQQGFWAYQMDISSQRVTTTDTVIDGVVGRGDALAVRQVNHVPEIDPASTTSALTLLLGCMAVVRGRRKIVVRRK